MRACLLLINICDSSSIEDFSFPKLELSEFLHPNQRRNDRQFKQAAENSEDGVAIGLIDALQRWADALEAQINLMRSEVVTLKSANRDLRNQVTELKESDAELRIEMQAMQASLQVSPIQGVSECMKNYRVLKSDY